MIRKKVICLVFLGPLVGKSIYAAKEHISSNIPNEEELAPDSLSIGQNAKRRLFSCDGDEIVIKNCEKKIEVKSPGDCQNLDGKPPAEVRIPKGTFAAGIISQVTIENKYRLNPLGVADIEALKTLGASVTTLRHEEVMLSTKVKELEGYISQLGTVKDPPTESELNNLKPKLERLRNELRNADNFIPVKNKVNRMVENVISKICNKNEVNVFGNGYYANTANTFEASVLEHFDPEFPCGLTGSIANRIGSCGFDRADGKLALLSRSKGNNGRISKYYIDRSKSGGGLIWGPVADKRFFTHKEAVAYCKGLNDLGLKWRIPTVDDERRALDNPDRDKKSDGNNRPGVESRAVNKVLHSHLPGMNARFWWLHSGGEEAAIYSGDSSIHSSIVSPSRSDWGPEDFPPDWDREQFMLHVRCVSCEDCNTK